METGVGRTRRRRVWFATGVIRRNAAALAAGALLAIVPAGVAAALTSNANLHSWSEVAGSAGIGQHETSGIAYEPVANTTSPTSGVTVAAAGLAGVVGTLALMLLLMVVSFATSSCSACRRCSE